jgi:hypothetical protein
VKSSSERSAIFVPSGLAGTRKILAGNKRRLTRAELHQKAGEAIREGVAGACLWPPDARLGDYRFVVFAIMPAKGVDVFVQLWSEPDGPVEWEVSSGQFNDKTAAWMPKDLDARLRPLGFTLPDRSASRDEEPQNYSQEVTIRTRRDVTRVTRAVLNILHDVFGYRGLKAIDVTLVSEGRAEDQPVYSAFTPAEICKIAARVGCSAKVAADDTIDEGTCTIRLRKRRSRAEMVLGDRADGGADGEELYASGFVGASVVSSEANAGVRRALRRERRPLRPTHWRVGVTMHFDGGVTAEWVAKRIEHGMRLAAAGRRT